MTPAFGFGPRLESVRLDLHQLGTRAARRALRPLLTPVGSTRPLPDKRPGEEIPFHFDRHPDRSPRIRTATFPLPRRIYAPAVLVVTGFAAGGWLTPARTPHMRFVFLGAEFCPPASSPQHLTMSQLPSAKSRHHLLLQRTYTS